MQYAIDIGIKNANEPTANGTAASIIIGYSNTASSKMQMICNLNYFIRLYDVVQNINN